MSNIILYSTIHEQMLPLTFARPTGDLRIGILTIKEKWEKRLKAMVSFQTEAYLQEKFPARITEDNLVILDNHVPNDALIKEIKSLEIGEVLIKEEVLIALRLNEANTKSYFSEGSFKGKIGSKHSKSDFITINRPYDIFSNNKQALQEDYDWLTTGRTSQPISATNTVLSAENIFLEEGASVECSILNATTGPIYIGKNALIMEGCIIRGGLAMCEKSVLKMGAKIYGATTLGTYCKVGGEVNNAVFQAYSNKGHDGFLGNAVIGEWCNLGADTNNSNLKNNYAPVRLWNYTNDRFTPTGLQFCGLIMGDHSKCGINTMFNTGTVVGFSANIFGGDFPRNFIPSFSWGGKSKIMSFRMNKAQEVAERMMGRRKQTLTEADKKIFDYIMENTTKYRSWEKK